MPAYQSQRPSFSLGPGDSIYLFGVLTSFTIATPGNSGLVRFNGIVTVTTTAAHFFVPGQPVDIRNAGSTGGFQYPYGFDGSFTILSVPSATTFTYYDPQKPNDTGGGGQAIGIMGENVSVATASLQICVLSER